MSRIDFGWCFFENVKELLLFVILHAWARAYVRSLYSCVRNSILTYAGMFLSFYICGNGPAYVGVMFTYVGFDPRMWDAWQKLYSAHFHFLFNRFTTICNPNTPFVIFSSKHRYILLFIFILTSKTSFFINFAWIKNLMPSSSFLHSSSPAQKYERCG